MSERLSCCIQGCRRTTAKPFSEWICAVHWARLTKRERQVWHRIKRQIRRLGVDPNEVRSWRVWESLKRRAGG